PTVSGALPRFCAQRKPGPATRTRPQAYFNQLDGTAGTSRSPNTANQPRCSINSRKVATRGSSPSSARPHRPPTRRKISTEMVADSASPRNIRVIPSNGLNISPAVSVQTVRGNGNWVHRTIDTRYARGAQGPVDPTQSRMV